MKKPRTEFEILTEQIQNETDIEKRIELRKKKIKLIRKEMNL